MFCPGLGSKEALEQGARGRVWDGACTLPQSSALEGLAPPAPCPLPLCLFGEPC